MFPTAAIARRLPACGPGATVYFETAQSLIQHGFCRILFQQETKAIAVNLNDAVETMTGAVPSQVAPTAQAFDRHSGVNETSCSIFVPSLVDLDKATQPQLSFHLTSRECFRWWPPQTALQLWCFLLRRSSRRKRATTRRPLKWLQPASGVSAILARRPRNKADGIRKYSLMRQCASSIGGKNFGRRSAPELGRQPMST